MAPPTGSEQLIRDYLNRLSVAARDLAPDDRRALLERTRGLIEQKADLTRRPSTMDVGRVLARLGDPARLVEQERRRLAAPGRPPRPPAPPAPPASGRQRFLARALGREHDRFRGPSFGWPAQPYRRDSGPVAPLNGVANGVHQPVARTESDSRTAAAAAAAAEQPGAHPEPTPSPVDLPRAANGTAHVTTAPSDAESAPDREAAARRHGSPDPGAEQQPADAASSAAGTERDVRGALPPAEPTADQIGPADESVSSADVTATGSARDAAVAVARPDDPPWRHPRAVPGPVLRQVGRLLAGARKRPLEAAAIVLMGIGGPIFPPVFLIGATLALASELWDGRDKWVGLALPIVLTVIGLAVGVAAGGRAHWMHEGWVYLDVVSRVAPAVGAGYLAWRCGHPRQSSSVPPFTRPYRAS